MLKVLIVEDEDIIRQGLMYTIDWLSLGWMVVAAAADGQEGLTLIKEHKPDLVLTDIIMPKMNGIEMLETARKEKLSAFRSVILTSYAEFEYARQAVKLDVFDYLLKPIDEDELKKVIDMVKADIVEGTKLVDKQEQGQSNVGEILDWSFYINGETVKNTYVLRALYAIRDHYGEKISIESIAEEQQVSASYLSRKFKESTAQTFLEFLTRYRIQKAIGFLRQGTYRVYEVSDMTGFSDYKHFCTVFKKYTQMSPKEFTKNIAEIIQQ